MKTKTYYIVEHRDGDGDKRWIAHSKNILTIFGIFINEWKIAHTSTHSAEDCKQRLINHLKYKNTKPKLIEVVKVEI